VETIEVSKAGLANEYDALARKFKELYLDGKDRGREAMSTALESARIQLTAAGDFGVEQGQELKRYLARDLDQTITKAQHWGNEARDGFHSSRLGVDALASLVSILDLTSNALSSLSSKAKDALSYRSGELASAGTLSCQSCGQEVQLKTTGDVPFCPKCNATLFRKD